MGGPLLLLVALLLGGAGAPCPETSAPDLRADLPRLGTVEVWGIVRWKGLGREAQQEARAVFCHGRRRLLRQDDFRVTFPGAIHSLLLHPTGWPSPVISIVVPWVAGDGGRWDALLLVDADGRLEAPLGGLSLEDRDALCLGDPAEGAAVTLVRFVPRDGCAVCSPNTFRATLYEWRDGRLIEARSHTTRHRHQSWRSAMRELHLPCAVEIVATTETKGH